MAAVGALTAFVVRIIINHRILSVVQVERRFFSEAKGTLQYISRSYSGRAPLLTIAVGF